MNKCQSETFAGKRCTRYASDRATKFCWQHTTEKKVEKKDLPKRPLSSFMLFAVDIRKSIKSEHPDWDIPDIGCEIARKWKSAPVPVIEHYTQLAMEGQKKYNEAMEAIYNE